MDNKAVIFFGFNDPLRYKRGVENVIWSQAQAVDIGKIYYIYMDPESDRSATWGKVEVIGVKKDASCYRSLNKIVGNLIRFYQRENVVIHSHHYLMSAFLWWRTDIFTIHDGLYYQAKFARRNFLVKISHWLLEKWVYSRSRLIHVISRYTKEQLLIGTRHVEQIGNTSFLEGKLSATDPTTQPVALSVRSIETRAGIDLVIAAAEHFQKSKINLSFRVAGKGPLLDRYVGIARSKQLQNIQFLGYVSDEALVDEYTKATFVLVTSLYGEGFGLPVIEGYVFNKPVIASNVCALPEMIIDRKFLFENRVDDLVKRISEVLDGKLNGFDFRKYYDAHFSNVEIESRYRALYQNLKRLRNL
jgi:glycosyltransferase involved in cell wall biosynthesis